MATSPRLTRPQISKIVNGDEVAIRFFEALIAQVQTDTPSNLEAVQDEAENASSTASTALNVAQSLAHELSRVADALEMAPFRIEEPEDVLLPVRFETDNKYHGVFHDSTTQVAGAINTPQAITFNATDMSQGVYIGATTSRVYVNGHGTYNFQFSAQLDRTAGGVSVVYIWARVNGVDIPDSAGKIRIKDNNSEIIAAWNYVLHMGAGDYFELVWETDDTSTVILAETSTATHPAVPSVILTVTNNID